MTDRATVLLMIRALQTRIDEARQGLLLTIDEDTAHGPYVVLPAGVLLAWVRILGSIALDVERAP